MYARSWKYRIEIVGRGECLVRKSTRIASALSLIAFSRNGECNY